MAENALTWYRPQSPGDLIWVRRQRIAGVPASADNVLVIQDGSPVVCYDPMLRAEALHRIWAQAPATPEGIIAFARANGPLLGKDGAGRDDDYYMILHRHSVWIREAVGLFDLVTANDQAVLAKCIVWEGPGLVHYRPMAEKPPLEDTDTHDSRVLWKDLLRDNPDRERVPQGDLIQPAMHFIASRVISPGLAGNNRTLLLVSRGGRGANLVQTPINLLGAIYLQFALEVTGNRSPKKCYVCGTWMNTAKLSKKGRRRSRSDHFYCSDACRSKAYRQRRESSHPAGLRKNTEKNR